MMVLNDEEVARFFERAPCLDASLHTEKYQAYAWIHFRFYQKSSRQRHQTSPNTATALSSLHSSMDTAPHGITQK